MPFPKIGYKNLADLLFQSHFGQYSVNYCCGLFHPGQYKTAQYNKYEDKRNEYPEAVMSIIMLRFVDDYLFKLRRDHRFSVIVHLVLPPFLIPLIY
jgi:hypothetical protein